MNAPDRSAEVRALCSAHPEAFGDPPETNDARRLALLRTWIIPALNRLDDGQWGLLLKPEQNNRLICDCIVWRDTREHFDVLTGTGATWIPHGLMHPAWVWTAVIPPLAAPAEPQAPAIGSVPLPVPEVVPTAVPAPQTAIVVPEPPVPPVVPTGLAGIASAIGAWLGTQAIALLMSWWSKRQAAPKPSNPISGAIPRPPAPTRSNLPK
jgi:hypothetical protein